MQMSVDDFGPAGRRGVSPAFLATEQGRFFGGLALGLMLLLAVFVGCSLYEWGVLGESQLGVRKPPFLAPYYLGRFVAVLFLSGFIAAGLYRWRATDAAVRRATMTPQEMGIAVVMLAVTVASTLLFVLDARLFNRLSLEDKPLEWISALLPLAASVGFVLAFVCILRAPQRDLRRRVALAFCALLAFALFVIGMEEISWMQRLFDIATPDLFAKNQQQEMNFHNMHSIVIGQVYKIAMFAALVLLPFVVDLAPSSRLLDAVADFLPSRFVFAISAPWAAFNYNEWNFLGSQLFVTLTLAILACYLKAAWDRHDRGEAALFGAIAVFILLAQPLFLILGERFVRMWDASEYVELFIAVGLAFYAAETVTRLAARYGGETEALG